MRFRLVRPRPDLTRHPSVRAVAGTWSPPARRDESLLSPDSFVFLGQRGSLSEVGWDGEQREKLWRYNQHYFDDLNARGAYARTAWHAELLQSWVTSNAPGCGTGWEPYPTSIRIVNWIKWTLAGQQLTQECLQSLAVQTRWLTRRLEVHLLGNHLFANGKALVFAGLFFDGAEAEHWTSIGVRILSNELDEQVLFDGGHFERSTMYHALALEDVLDLYNLLKCYSGVVSESRQRLSAKLRKKAHIMLDWLMAMCHPDGEIAFFNDAAFGVAPTPRELVEYASALGIANTEQSTRTRWLRESGYARLAVNNALAVLDMAPIGPDYLPGHAHADTLSFELSLFGQRVIVNSGTSTYRAGIERSRQRSTVAHSTVTVASCDSSEVWAAFRVGKRARVLSAQVEDDCATSSAVASHDGYARLPGRPVHVRQWKLTAGALIVEDEVTDKNVHAEAHFYVHPSVRLTWETQKNGGTLVLSDMRAISWRCDRGQVRVEAATWHPAFGVSIPSQCIIVRLQNGRSSLNMGWR